MYSINPFHNPRIALSDIPDTKRPMWLWLIIGIAGYFMLKKEKKKPIQKSQTPVDLHGLASITNPEPWELPSKYEKIEPWQMSLTQWREEIERQQDKWYRGSNADMNAVAKELKRLGFNPDERGTYKEHYQRMIEKTMPKNAQMTLLGDLGGNLRTCDAWFEVEDKRGFKSHRCFIYKPTCGTKRCKNDPNVSRETNLEMQGSDYLDSEKHGIDIMPRQRQEELLKRLAKESTDDTLEYQSLKDHYTAVKNQSITANYFRNMTGYTPAMAAKQIERLDNKLQENRAIRDYIYYKLNADRPQNVTIKSEYKQPKKKMIEEKHGQMTLFGKLSGYTAKGISLSKWKESPKSESFEEFLNSIRTPRKPIREGQIDDYVIIWSDSYGIKTAKDYNIGIPREGQIIKINPSTVSVKIKNKVYKYPAEAKITNDLTPFIGLTTEQIKDFYYNANPIWKRKERIISEKGGQMTLFGNISGYTATCLKWGRNRLGHKQCKKYAPTCGSAAEGCRIEPLPVPGSVKEAKAIEKQREIHVDAMAKMLADDANTDLERNKELMRKILAYGGIAPHRGGFLREEYNELPDKYKRKGGIPLDELAQELGTDETKITEEIYKAESTFQYLKSLRRGKTARKFKAEDFINDAWDRIGKGKGFMGLGNLGTFPWARALRQDYLKDEYKYTYDEFAKKAFYTKWHRRTDNTFEDFKNDRDLRNYYYTELEKAIYQNKSIPQKVINENKNLYYDIKLFPYEEKYIPSGQTSFIDPNQMALFGGYHG